MFESIGSRIETLFEESAPPVRVEELRVAAAKPIGRSNVLAGLAAGLVTLVVVGTTAFLAGEEPPAPTTPEVPAGQKGTFQPPTRTIGEATHLDLTLLDGSSITLAYPADLDLTSLGVEAQAAGGVGAVNRTIITRYGPPEDFVAQNEANQGPGQLTRTFIGPDGNAVERWDFPDIPFIVFDFAPWTAYVWDTKVEVGEVAEGWVANLHGAIDPSGFLVLTADPPLQLVPAEQDPGPDGPDIRVDGTSGSLLVFINDCDRMTRLDDETYGSEVFAFCDEATNTLFFVGGTAEVQQRIHENLRINPEDPGTTTSSTTSTTLAADFPPNGPIFGEETGVVLLLDDGLEGLTAVDLDGRRAARSLVEGQRSGDEQYSMVRLGDHLVVGWNFIYAVDIRTRESRELGQATIFVPAAEPEAVWLIDYPSGSIGGGWPTVWQVGISGDVIIEPTTLSSDSIVLRGIEGGLVLQTSQGIELWDAATGEITAITGGGPGFVHDVHGSRIAWCAGTCDSYMITGGIQFEAPTGKVYKGASFSGDGRFLAMILADNDDYRGDELVVLDLETGGSSSLAGNGPINYLAWSPDNTQIFATGHSYGDARTAVWRYEPIDGDFDSVILPFGGGLTPVVIDRDMAEMYFGNNDQDDCLSAGNLVINPEICTYDF